MIFQSSRYNASRERKGKLFQPQEYRAPFNVPISNNFHRFSSVGNECQGWCLSEPASMWGEIWTKNCFGLKSKVPFFTDWFWTNLQRVCRMGMECRLRCLRHPAAKRSEKMTNSCADLKSKVPLVNARYRQTCTECGARGRSAICDVRVTPVECEVIQESKTVSASGVKCLSLQPDYDQVRTSCGACEVNNTCDDWVATLQCEDRYVRKYVLTLRLKCPSLQPVPTEDLEGVDHGAGVQLVMFESHHFYTRRVKEEKVFSTESKVPFFTVRVRRNLHMWSKKGKCAMCDVWVTPL
jgi:hypothetical protein